MTEPRECVAFGEYEGYRSYTRAAVANVYTGFVFTLGGGVDRGEGRGLFLAVTAVGQAQRFTAAFLYCASQL